MAHYFDYFKIGCPSPVADEQPTLPPPFWDRSYLTQFQSKIDLFPFTFAYLIRDNPGYLLTINFILLCTHDVCISHSCDVMLIVSYYISFYFFKGVLLLGHILDNTWLVGKWNVQYYKRRFTEFS